MGQHHKIWDLNDREKIVNNPFEILTRISFSTHCSAVQFTVKTYLCFLFGGFLHNVNSDLSIHTGITIKCDSIGQLFQFDVSSIVGFAKEILLLEFFTMNWECVQLPHIPSTINQILYKVCLVETISELQCNILLDCSHFCPQLDL